VDVWLTTAPSRPHRRHEIAVERLRGTTLASKLKASIRSAYKAKTAWRAEQAALVVAGRGGATERRAVHKEDSVLSRASESFGSQPSSPPFHTALLHTPYTTYHLSSMMTTIDLIFSERMA